MGVFGDQTAEGVVGDEGGPCREGKFGDGTSPVAVVQPALD